MTMTMDSSAGSLGPSGTVAGETNPNQPMTRIVLAEDELLLREGMASLLERSGFKVVGQAGDAVQLLALVSDTSPDLVVVDIRMPPTPDSRRARGCPGNPPAAPGHRHSGLVSPRRGRTRHGAAGERSGDRLSAQEPRRRRNGIRRHPGTHCKGGSVVDPALVQELVSIRRRTDPLDALSERERDVLALMAEGRSNAGIARRLWVTEGTVEKHVRSILAKLNLPEAQEDHRRVLAVVTFLQAQ